MAVTEEKKSALIYCDWLPTIEKMSDEDAGMLLKHLLRYINDLEPIAPNVIVDLVFEPVKQQLKRDLDKWRKKSKKNSETAKERWDKIRTDANAYERIKKNASDTVTDTVTDTVSVNVNDISQKGKTMREIFFDDLPGSRNFESIAMDLIISKDRLKTFIPGFVKKAEMHYQDFNRFCSHFKNYVNKEIKTSIPEKVVLKHSFKRP